MHRVAPRENLDLGYLDTRTVPFYHGKTTDHPDAITDRPGRYTDHPGANTLLPGPSRINFPSRTVPGHPDCFKHFNMIVPENTGPKVRQGVTTVRQGVTTVHPVKLRISSQITKFLVWDSPGSWSDRYFGSLSAQHGEIKLIC